MYVSRFGGLAGHDRKGRCDMRVTREYAMRKLEERKVRLARFLELKGPEVIIEQERRLVREAIYMLETGELPPKRADEA